MPIKWKKLPTTTNGHGVSPFILIFRLGEAQLVKMALPFLLDESAVGGFGLSTSNIGFVYGTAGMISGWIQEAAGYRYFFIWV